MDTTINEQYTCFETDCPKIACYNDLPGTCTREGCPMRRKISRYDEAMQNLHKIDERSDRTFLALMGGVAVCFLVSLFALRNN